MAIIPNHAPATNSIKSLQLPCSAICDHRVFRPKVVEIIAMSPGRSGPEFDVTRSPAHLTTTPISIVGTLRDQTLSPVGRPGIGHASATHRPVRPVEFFIPITPNQRSNCRTKVRRFSLSASAMSRTLARLRAATGDPLLVRAGRGMVPTPMVAGFLDDLGCLGTCSEPVIRPSHKGGVSFATDWPRHRI